MKIFGIGTDIINIKRMEKTLKKDGGSFKKKVFSENEEKNIVLTRENFLLL